VVSAKQGDVSLIHDPVAQELLQSKAPAHLAYTWRDGTPRVVPMGFHWNGQEIVLATVPDAPKMKALTDGARVALTIESDGAPPKVLLVRGAVRVDTVEGIAPEWAAAAYRTQGAEGGRALVENSAAIYPRMSRIFVQPEWVGILDFETRLPSAVARAIARTQTGTH
jgi:hypothetical protein